MSVLPFVFFSLLGWNVHAASQLRTPLDLPAELVADVNKPPFPTVNVISEGASADSEVASERRAFRLGQLQNEKEQLERSKYYAASIHEGNALLATLEGLAAQ